MEGESWILLLLGPPGSGKSAMLADIVRETFEASIPVLGIKADFIPVSVGSLEDLRVHLQLEQSIVDTLQHVVDTRGTALLVIDQLDALCELVDSRTSRLNVLIGLLRKAKDMPNLRVVASVRPFEARHESRLRRLCQGAKIVDLAAISRADAKKILPWIDESLLDSSLLTPHALDLLACMNPTESRTAIAVPGSIGKLRERFWEAAMARSESAEDAALKVARMLSDEAPSG